MVHRNEFLRIYRPDVAVAFHRNGQDAQWASPTSDPRVWGDEDNSITLDTDDAPDKARIHSAMAVSPDGRLLAATASSVIQVFEFKTQKLLSELKGNRHYIDRLVFAPLAQGNPEDGTAARYTLLSMGTDEGWRKFTIIPWSLDSNGCQVAALPFTPFEVNRRTETAMSAISTDLQQEHGVTEAETESIRTALRTAIDAVEKHHRLKTLPHVQGTMPHYNDTDLFSFNGRDMKVLYLVDNESTQHGMRPAENLPQIIVATFRQPKLSTNDNNDGDEDAGNNRRFHTFQILRGHTDKILSAAFSPDGRLVTSASWDQTYRIWSVETGECLHSIGPTGNQNWVAKFTPSGKRVLLSGGGGSDKASPLALYDTSTCQEISRLRHPDLDSWLRTIAVHPDGKSAVVANAASLLLWDLTEENNTDNEDEDPPKNAIEILRLAIPDQETNPADHRVIRPFASLSDVSWVDGGKKLLVRASDHTVFVWNREQNVQWRFQKPDGMEFKAFSCEFAYVDDNERGRVVSLDGDGKVRFRKL